MRKSFTDQMKNRQNNPAAQFVTEPEAQPIRQPEAEQQPRRKPPEAKSRRMQILIRPSLYEALKAAADEEYLSVNELINEILTDAIKKER